jgi:hypothetical protein
MKKNPHAVALGRLGGSVTSKAKKISSRENGKLGGRPPKTVTQPMDHFGIPQELMEMTNVPKLMDLDELEVLMNQVNQGELTAIPEAVKERMHD